MRHDATEAYYDSAAGITITRRRAFKELKSHGVVDFQEFLDEVGDRKFYSAQGVLNWLGY